MSGAQSPESAAVLLQLRIAHVCNVTFLAIALAAFIARVCMRIKTSGSLRIDDWTMAVAMIFYTATCITGIIENNLLKDFFDYNVAVNLATVQVLARLLNLFYVLTVIAVKVSLGFFFLQIFNVNQKVQRLAIWVLMGLSSISGLVFGVMIEATCGISVADPKCALESGFNAVSMAWSILNAISDVVLTSLAVQALRSSMLKPYVKVSAMALLTFACIGGAISIVRVVVNAGTVTRDPILKPIEISRWSTIEGGIYITTSCLVTLRALLQSLWQRFVGSEIAPSTQATGAVTARAADYSTVQVGDPKKGGAFAQVITTEISADQAV